MFDMFYPFLGYQEVFFFHPFLGIETTLTYFFRFQSTHFSRAVEAIPGAFAHRSQVDDGHLGEPHRPRFLDLEVSG